MLAADPSGGANPVAPKKPVAPVPVVVSHPSTVAAQPAAGVPNTPALAQQMAASSQPSVAQQQKTSAAAYDYSADPILLQAKAYALSADQQAQAQADAKQAQLSLEYNGAGNPFSTVARLNRQYGENQTATNEQYNKSNLFYSGHRAKALSDLATALQQSLYDAANQYRGQSTDVANQLASALLADRQQVIQANNDAYNRALQQALQYGIDPGAPATDQTPGSATPGAGTTIAPGATAPDFFGPLGNATPSQVAQALQPAPAPSTTSTAPSSSSSGVVWGGQTFTTKKALASWLSAHGASYATWAANHPSAAAKLK